MHITTVIPAFSLDSDRKRNLEFICDRLHEQLGSDNTTIIAVQDEKLDSYYNKFPNVVKCYNNRYKEFNKSFIFNSILDTKIESDFVLLLDADIYLPFKEIKKQLEIKDKIIKPFKECVYLDTDTTNEFIYQKKSRLSSDFKSLSAIGGGAVIINTSILEDKSIRFDESFEGWGWEDIDFGDNLRSKFKIKTLNHTALHLYHEPLDNKQNLNNYEHYCNKNKYKNKLVHVFSYICTSTASQFYDVQQEAVQSYIEHKTLDVLLLNGYSNFCFNDDNIKPVKIKRTSRSFEELKDLPFLNDLIELSVPYVEDGGWIFYSNPSYKISSTLYSEIIESNCDYIEFYEDDESSICAFAIKADLAKKHPLPDIIDTPACWNDISNLYSNVSCNKIKLFSGLNLVK
jgi:hypothetical protein